MNKATLASIQPTEMKKVGNVWVTPPAITDPKKRLAALRQAFGMWKNRKPDPIKELEKMRREQRMKLPDSVIAATALFTGTTLVTRNIRDFKRIPNLSVEKI